jgi:drug/metabolite transporter (DMT)-like permease
LDNKNTKPLLAYLAVSFIWGSTYIAIRVGVMDLPPLLFASSRVLIAGIILAIFAKLKGYSFPSNFKDIGKISTVGLLMLLGGGGLIVTASQWVDAGIASIVVATVPLMMALIEALFLKQVKIGVLGIIGLFIGFGGVVYLSMGDMGSSATSTKGVLFLLLASLSWSAGSIYSKSITTKNSMITTISIQMLAGGIGLLILGLILGEAKLFIPTLNSMLSLLYLVTFGSIIAYSCYIYVLKQWSAAKAGTYAYINPIVAVLLGGIVLGEQITYKVIISLAIILAGVLLVQRSKAKNIAS